MGGPTKAHEKREAPDEKALEEEVSPSSSLFSPKRRITNRPCDRLFGTIDEWRTFVRFFSYQERKRKKLVYGEEIPSFPLKRKEISGSPRVYLFLHRRIDD
jgi:hypothetical protein